jgi:large subunit ribosomal protein L23
MSAILVTPRVSEKAYAEAQQNTYVFNAPLTANKQQIAEAVAEQYGVGVASIRVIVIKGKPVRASRGKRAYPGTALRTKKKKAYVTLVEGDSIKLFDEEEEKK